jgi:hypothetical protein
MPFDPSKAKLEVAQPKVDKATADKTISSPTTKDSDPVLRSDVPSTQKFNFDPSKAKLEQKRTSKGDQFAYDLVEAASPAIEGLAGLAGVILGTPEGGPFGAVAGGGLFYGATKTFFDNVKTSLKARDPDKGEDVYLSPVSNIMEGMSNEMLGQGFGSVLKGATKAYQGYKKTFRTATEKAAQIAHDTFGSNVAQAREILKEASEGISASQALAVIDEKTGKAALNAQTAQALLQRAQMRDPEFFANMFGEQAANRIKTLEEIARGSNQTEARQAQEELRKELNGVLIPRLEIEINAANEAGKRLPGLQAKADRFLKMASNAVEDVRRFVGARERAQTTANTTVTVPGQPRVPGRYTYMGELAQRADQVADQAAAGSLEFGQAAIFHQAAADSLAQHGLYPLKAESIILKIANKLKDPKLAGNQDVAHALMEVGNQLKLWTDNNGVIDAWALDSIRKNSVNGIIAKLYPQSADNFRKKLASQVMSSLKPMIVDAVEEAGGTGYRQYLEDYSIGSQHIAQTKLGAELMRLYQTSPKQFVRLVEGNDPDAIEAIFGPNSYNYFKEMSGNIQKRIGKVAGELKREDIIQEQSSAGIKRLEEVLQTNLNKFRLPRVLSRKVAVMNHFLDEIEGKVSKGTMKALTEASKSAKNLEELLSKVPKKVRDDILSEHWISRIQSVSPGGFETMREVTPGSLVAPQLRDDDSYQPEAF